MVTRTPGKANSSPNHPHKMWLDQKKTATETAFKRSSSLKRQFDFWSAV
jgi:hypothetical protein